MRCQIWEVRCQISGGELPDSGMRCQIWDSFDRALSDLGSFFTVRCQIWAFFSVRCQIWAFFSVRCQIWELWENGPVKWGSGGQNKKTMIRIHAAGVF